MEEGKVISEVADRFDKTLNSAVDKFKEVLHDVASSKNVRDELLYEELTDLKSSLNQLNKDVGIITNSVEKLSSVADALKNKVEDTEKIKDKGRVYILAGKIVMGIGGSIMAFFLFLKDNIYDLARWINKLLE